MNNYKVTDYRNLQIYKFTVYRNDWLKLTFNCLFTIQPGNYQFQLTNHLIWFAFVTTFSTGIKKQISMKKKSRKLRSQILTCYIFQVLFSKKSWFYWKKTTLQENIAVFEEGLDCIDIDDVGNLENSSRFVFINEECGNLIVVNDGEELTRNINQKTKPNVLQYPIDVQ